MTKKQRERFNKWWSYFVGGIPLNEGFEMGVVRLHCEKAFLAGIKFMKDQPTKEQER